MNARRLLFLLTVVLALSATSALAGADLAIRAERIYPVSAPPIDVGVILIEEGRIKQVGSASKVRIPSGVEIIEAEVVTPGFVDVHTVVGFAGVYNSDKGQVQDQDQLEKSDPVQPELRAVDAYNPVEPLVEWARSLGVTTVHSGHGPGAVISGQTLVAKTGGERVEDVTLIPAAAVAATLDSSVARNFTSPGTHAKNASALREALVSAQSYASRAESGSEHERDLRKETLARVLSGELALMITAHSSTEIATALRLQREFGFRLWLDGAAEAYRMIEPLREAGVPVLLHPTMMRAWGDAKNLALDTASVLQEAGIPFAIQSGYESYVPKTRVVLYEAQVAVRYGLSPEDALHAITLAPARILGLDGRIGSLQPGKDADLVLFDGDPFEYTTHVCKVLVEGKIVSDVCR